MRKSKKDKVAKKALLQNIKESLIKDLKESTSEIAKRSKKLDKLINKESKKLVKQLAKKLKINKAAIKSNDRPSVTLEESGASNNSKSVSKPVKKSPTEKVKGTATASAGSGEHSAAQAVKKAPVARKAKTTE